jgi:hypothetical protein
MIAMIVVVVCFGIGSMIYMNIIGSGNMTLRLRATLVMNEIAEQAKKDKDFTDDKLTTKELTIVKKMESFQSLTDLKQFTLIAFDKDGKRISEYKELILVEPKIK